MRNTSSTARLALTLAALAAATPASAAVEYDLVIIEPWDTSYPLASSKVAGINNLNQVTGCASPVDGGCSFIWTLDSGKQQTPYAGPINDQGFIVVDDYLVNPDGSIIQMKDQAGYTVAGLDINNAGTVAGVWGSATCQFDGEAATWTPDHAVTLFFQDLDIFAADHLRAVNELDQVVGVRTIIDGCGSDNAFAYDMNSGEFTDIHQLLVGNQTAETEAFDINDLGVILGQGPHAGAVSPFLWTKQQGFTFLPPPEGALPTNTHLTAINNAGTAVGWAITESDAARAIIWDSANATRDLNALLNAPDGFVITEASDINENGWIIGLGRYTPAAPTRAVVLIPVNPTMPEDLDNSGAVDSADLNLVLAQFGCADSCDADINADGTVNSTDLNMVLAAFGDLST